MRHNIICGVRSSTNFSLQAQSSFENWPGVQEEGEQTSEGNHVSILILAWAYILSSRWVELQSLSSLADWTRQPLTCMRYSNVQAELLQESKELHWDASQVDIGATSEHVARWWASILAPGEGWHATIAFEDRVYRSPWSVCNSSTQPFRIRGKISSGTPWTSPSSHSNRTDIRPSSEEALSYLLEYCELYNISSECKVALAASLFLPWKNSEQTSLILSTPKSCKAAKDKRLLKSRTWRSRIREEFYLLPYYMTLSCNVRGLRALLCGTFFEPSAPCNLVSPWLQSAFEVLDQVLVEKESTSLAIIMSKRQPRLAPLWLAAVIFGLEKTILQPLRIGLTTVDLHAEAWSGTFHSFIHFRPHTPCVTSTDEILRSHECRLLFLSGSESHSRLPVCPWQPFGTTPIALADIGVRQHARCNGHFLQYVSWSWDSDEGSGPEDYGFNTNGPDDWNAVGDEIKADGIDTRRGARGGTKSELLSTLATRSIFGWLRADGYPPTEREIFIHEWLDIGDSSEQSEISSDSSVNEEHCDIDEWLENVG